MNNVIFAKQKNGARSSVGSEHLVYTQGVRGSNPFAPTATKNLMDFHQVFFYN